MTGPGISEDDELTPEGLCRDKSELFSGTALGDAIERKEEERHEKLTKARELVEAKVALAQADEAGVEDSAVEALRDAVGELSEDIEAEALVENREEIEAREKINELEALANSTEGKSSASFEQKAEALRAEHGLEEEPGRYDVEALVDEPDTEDAEAEALAEFQDRKHAENIDTELMENLPDEVAARLSDFKMMAAGAQSEKIREMYEEKIEAIREEYAESDEAAEVESPEEWTGE